MTATGKKTGYDRYVSYRRLSIAVGAFLVVLLMPLPDSMVRIGMQYAVGPDHVRDLFANRLFGKDFADVEQWQAMTARILEANAMQGALGRARALSRNEKFLRDNGIDVEPGWLDRFRARIAEVPEADFRKLMEDARELRYSRLRFGSLPEKDRVAALGAGRKIQIVFAMLVFVVVCFLTEAMPMPGVAFCVGLILVFSGIVGRAEVASLYWSDAVWFILGSLMFAAAFVKTGVDRRLCLAIFRWLAKPKVPLITGILILVISPLAAFISDHALAAMFLPIAVILYTNSLTRETGEDTELAKMLMITVAMACNVGGFGAPSGGARNVIVMTYLEDMFGVNVGYGEWMVFGFPYVLVMMVFLWFMLNWRFKPKIRDLGPALAMLKADIARSGGWTGKQKVTLVIFVVMVFGWITEKDLVTSLIGVRLGIGVIAMAGAVAYLLAGVVNWRDYQTRVDWGVVWLYGGAIILGKVLADTGTAYWLATTVVSAAAPLGLDHGTGLLALGGSVTAGLTQLMADGPAAACIAPVTLNMAAVTHPGTAMIPFMGLVTAAASSMAYLLVIGTPPNAIVYASGYLEMKDYLRVGIPCLLFGLVLLVLMATTYWIFLGFQGMPMPG